MSDRVEAAARALWRLGNERIGERPWEDVREHYLAEAEAALDAADSCDSRWEQVGEQQFDMYRGRWFWNDHWRPDREIPPGPPGRPSRPVWVRHG